MFSSPSYISISILLTILKYPLSTQHTHKHSCIIQNNASKHEQYLYILFEIASYILLYIKMIKIKINIYTIPLFFYKKINK